MKHALRDVIGSPNSISLTSLEKFVQLDLFRRLSSIEKEDVSLLFFPASATVLYSLY